MITPSAQPGRRGYLLRLLPALSYATLIFYLSSIQGNSIPSLGVDVSDKLLHVVEYFVLGFLLLWGVHLDRTKPIGHRRIFFAIGVAILYGASDEIHQYFVPGRSAETLDWAADSCGILLALLVYWGGNQILLKRKRAQTSSPG